MYKTVIEFKNDIPKEELDELIGICNKAFSTRVGKTVGKSEVQNQISYSGSKYLYGCLRLGVSSLRRINGFLDYVESWKWIDSNPSENCDMLEVFKMPVF